jgi:hypothetical protein
MENTTIETRRRRHRRILAVLPALAAAGCGGAPGDRSPARDAGGAGGASGAGDGAAGEARDGRPPRPDARAADAEAPAADELLLPHAGGAPWRAADIGAAGARGVFKLNTAPLDVQSVFLTTAASSTPKADGLSFLHVPLRGDGQVLAAPRLLPVMRDVLDNRAGVMIRESLDPDAAMIFAASGGDGVAGNVIYRKAKGAEAVTFPTREASPSRLTALRSGQWFRIVRAGTRFFVYAGSRGVVTTEDAPLVATVDLTLASPGGEMLYGVAATALDASAPFPCEFTGVQVDNLGVDQAWPLGGHVDVGTSLGAAVLGGGGKLVLSSWGMPWTTAANFHRESFTFVGASGLGDVSIAVRVDAIDGRSPYPFTGWTRPAAAREPGGRAGQPRRPG